jgi:acyl-CoA thioester hydrolase
MAIRSRWHAEVEVLVPFHDIDAMRIVWHGNYFRYFEIARCALLDTIGYDYEQMGASGYAWPVIDVRARFGKPARCGDRLVVEAGIMEYRHRLRIAYQIRDKETGRRLTRGSTTQVAVDLATNSMCYVSPPVLLERLGVDE